MESSGFEPSARKCVVFMSDFGTVDGAVSAMHGVVDSVDRTVRIEDLTHEIPQFNIWEASYRLIQAMNYWEKGTVFVCVVDPGVGSERKSLAVRTRSGHYVITPDNGTLTHVGMEIGIDEARVISEDVGRLSGSLKSNTFHGRDIYAYTGAKLASGVVDFADIGPVCPTPLVTLTVQKPVAREGEITGAIDILDARYGSVWTNIPLSMLEEARIGYGRTLQVEISHRDRIVYGYPLRLCRSFAEAGRGEALLYINSILNVGVAVNQGSFAAMYHVGTGEGWKTTLRY